MFAVELLRCCCVFAVQLMLTVAMYVVVCVAVIVGVICIVFVLLCC